MKTMTTTKSPTVELWTVSEVAARLRVDNTTVRRWIKDGALEAVTLPHNGNRIAYRIPGRVMDAILAEQEEPKG